MASSRQRFDESYKILKEAKKFFLGGVQASRQPFIPHRAPVYMTRAKGARCWDVDGNEYIDYSLSLGPVILGYADPDVEKAALQGLRDGIVFTLNHPLQNVLAAKVLEYTNRMNWVTFLKTGSCATSAAVRIARICTKRKKIARLGYHGWHDWCSQADDGVPKAVRGLTLEPGSEPDDIRKLFRREGKDIACFIVAPEGISSDADRVKDVLHVIRKATREYGSLMIMDEIKTCFRTLEGSVQKYFNITPDLTTIGKAMANGLPISAVAGRRKWARHATKAHISSTFNGEMVSMHAALATLDVLERRGGIEYIWELGKNLIRQCSSVIEDIGVEAEAFAWPFPTMPFVRFTYKDEKILQKARDTFFTQIISEGILCRPNHVWFISLAHNKKDVNRTIGVFAKAFEKTKRAL